MTCSLGTSTDEAPKCLAELCTCNSGNIGDSFFLTLPRAALACSTFNWYSVNLYLFIATFSLLLFNPPLTHVSYFILLQYENKWAEKTFCREITITRRWRVIARRIVPIKKRNATKNWQRCYNLDLLFRFNKEGPHWASSYFASHSGVHRPKVFLIWAQIAWQRAHVGRTLDKIEICG